MTDELDELIDLFRDNGGKFENAEIGYRDESGFYCSVIDNSRSVEIYCPEHLLISTEDLGINESGLYIAKPEKYTNNIEFFERYLSFHFGKDLVERLLEEENLIESLSEKERKLLANIHLSSDSGYTNGSASERLEQVKKRMFQYHQLFYKRLGTKVIMPVVSFVNHELSGDTISNVTGGVSVAGKFKNEIFARYSLGDVLMILDGYRFVTDATVAYSLPIWFQLAENQKIEVRRDIKKFTLVDDQFKFPEVEESDGGFVISWFPLYSDSGPYYPARIASYLAQKIKIPGEIILHQVYRQNLGALLPIVFYLNDCENSYLKLVLSGVKQQLKLIGGVPNI